AYLLIAKRQCEDASLAGSYNVGPKSWDCVTTRKLTELFCRAWGEGARCKVVGNGGGPHEDRLLKLDCEKIHAVLGWQPRWNVERAVAETVAWTKAWHGGADVAGYMEREIEEYEGNGNKWIASSK
ncbi:MAG: CDP-glucose 4,6-dehydratase, partial [Deltaproteobacteria bacterium]|nr:CDP-glucose 4,6-dehydratase [Deltaproteobacteria bacterium]